MRIVIGDVHGEFDTLMALIKKLPDAPITFVGDLIDRGPKSRQVIEFVKGRFDVVLGNHEDMAKSDMVFWLKNGGDKAIENYIENGQISPLLEEHIDWFWSLPHYIKYDMKVNDKDLVVSHAYVGNALLGDSPERIKQVALWNRSPLYLNENIFNVFGHTPNDDVIIGSNHANIDTGCHFNGKLTALVLPELTVIDQEKV